MKRFIWMIVCTLVGLTSYAERVNQSVLERRIPTSESLSYITNEFGAEGVTFLLENESSDDRLFHQTFQQYYNGIQLENHLLCVHSKDGFITSINGEVLTDIAAQSVAHYTPARSHIAGTPIIAKIDNAYRMVIRTYTPQATIYQDAFSGDTLLQLPTINFLQAQCSITTQYNYVPNQHIQCEVENNVYLLQNNQKNISTRLGDVTNIFLTGRQGIYPTSVQNYSSTQSNWKGHYLTSVTVHHLANHWWYQASEKTADLYIEIKDHNGKVVYVSDYKTDVRSFPVRFNISKMLDVPENGGYMIRVIDHCAADLDKCGCTYELESNEYGTYEWGNEKKNVQAELEISDWHPALDVEWALENVYDYYARTFAIKGFDNNNPAIKAYLHYPQEKNAETLYARTAFASGIPGRPTTAFLYFGLGNDTTNAIVGLTSVCHEYTHLITKYRSLGELVNQGESGALNEGFSDVFAIATEYFVKGTSNWLIAPESFPNGGIRNIAEPNRKAMPNTYGKNFWTSPNDISNDNGGIHKNSTILSHWFYLLVNGGAGVNDLGNTYKVDGIGIKKAEKIAWAIHHDYLMPTATFNDARATSIQFAKDYYGLTAYEQKAVTDAWYAVGVGLPYDGPDVVLPGKYIIVTPIEQTSSEQWLYLSTSDKDKSLDAQLSDTDINPNESVKDDEVPTDCVWEFIQVEDGWKIKNGSQYLSWNQQGQQVDSVGGVFDISVSNDTLVVSYFDGKENHYLNLSNNQGTFQFDNHHQNTPLIIVPIVDEDGNHGIKPEENNPNEKDDQKEEHTTPTDCHSLSLTYEDMILNGAEVYSLTGQPVRSYPLTSGIYIVRHQSKTVKILIP